LRSAWYRVYFDQEVRRMRMLGQENEAIGRILAWIYRRGRWKNGSSRFELGSAVCSNDSFWEPRGRISGFIKKRRRWRDCLKRGRGFRGLW
jgi:hypothetical protein